MIYLIGGCPRAGKSTLARLVCCRLGLGWISTDVVSEVVNVANPDVGYIALHDPDAAPLQADRFYPMFEKLVLGMHTITRDYVIEGVEFMPAQAVRVANLVPVRSCFLGWSDVTIASIDAYGGHDDWTRKMDEGVREVLPARLVQTSAMLERECAAYGVPYVDMAGDFEARLEFAYEALVGLAAGARGRSG